MAHRVIERRRVGGLGPRVASALVMAPAAIGLAYVGGVAFGLFIATLAAVMALEWQGFSREGETGSPSARAGFVAAAAVPVLFAVAGRIEIALASVLPALVTAALAARIGRARPSWWALGVVYIALPCIAIVWLRAAPGHGRETIFWLFAVVWATDIGAYAAGRLIGGPRLAPRISPNKTWAGLVGGVLAAAGAGVVLALLFDIPVSPPLALFGGFLGLISQAGDLWESMIKRRFGKKDSGSLIPGHGGVLDRLDGMMAAAPALALVAVALDGGGLRW